IRIAGGSPRRWRGEGLVMNTGKTLFAQLMDFLPWSTFDRIVARYEGNRAVRKLSCAAQYQIMAFAQLTYRESLRDIEACLSAQTAKRHHMKTQIWIAVSVYVLVAIVRKRLRLEAPLYTLLQVFSVAVFEKIEIQTAFSREADGFEVAQDDNQLNFPSF